MTTLDDSFSPSFTVGWRSLNFIGWDPLLVHTAENGLRWGKKGAHLVIRLRTGSLKQIK